MNIDMKLIDELIENLNSEIDELTVELDKTETELLILETNKKERHIRGGLATKEKYLQKQQHCQVKY